MKVISTLTRPRFILTFLIAVILCQIAFLFLYRALAAEGVPTTLDMMTGFTPQAARDHIKLYSNEAFRLLNWFQMVDLVFPAAYGLMFAGLTARFLGTLRPGSPRLVLLALVAPVGAVFDLCENVGIFIMVRVFPESIILPARLTAVVGIVKYVLITAALLLCAGLGVALLVKRIRARA
ncbi:MAG TPA: hypothetical protein ENN69_04210 [Spirochaetia bacterium]|nr:hypothetical protein [Spirochaetia bacterium]